MTARRYSIHAAATIALALAAAGTAAALVVGRPAPGVTLRAGDSVPASLQPAMAAVRGGPARHLILYSANCGWCARQLQALRELDPPPSGVVIVVATRPGEASALQAPEGIGVVYIDRARVENEIGRFGTPAHLWVNSHGALTGFSTGFKNAGALRHVYGARGPFSAPEAAPESCGEACGQR